ncbi:MAG: hypothetical protein ABIJ00_12160 [Candidatus Eisenbacteria bacterium]
MKKPLSVALLAVGFLCVGISENGYCGAAEEPFQLALFNPIQIRDEAAGIVGLRLNLIYGKNVYVTGLDLGLVNHCTGGETLGLQHGLVGYVEGDFRGWQDNMVSIVKGEFRGLQTGLYNEFGNGMGFQLGAVNRTYNMRGFQLGFVNYTETMHGLQIGLLNIIQSKKTWPALILVNWSF